MASEDLKRLSIDLPQRVQEKIQKRESGCWDWTGHITPYGYGQVWCKGKVRQAHRAVYEWLEGPIRLPTLDHLCRNRRCVRPSHLRQVRHRQNILAPGSEAITKRHGEATHCKHGHEYTPKNTRRNRRGGRDCRECERRKRRARDPEAARAYRRRYYQANQR